MFHLLVFHLQSRIRDLKKNDANPPYTLKGYQLLGSKDTRIIKLLTKINENDGFE